MDILISDPEMTKLFINKVVLISMQIRPEQAEKSDYYVYLISIIKNIQENSDEIHE